MVRGHRMTAREQLSRSVLIFAEMQVIAHPFDKANDTRGERCVPMPPDKAYLKSMDRPPDYSLTVLSPFLIVPVLTRFAPGKTNRNYTMINRGTVPIKIDRILRVTVLPRCIPDRGPCSTMVSLRCRPVGHDFTRVKRYK